MKKNPHVFLPAVLLLLSCSKFDVKTGPFSVTFKAEPPDTEAWIEVVPTPDGFASPEKITNGQTIDIDLNFDVPEITVYKSTAAPYNGKIWNEYRVVPGGFDYTIKKAANYDCDITGNLVPTKFAAGSSIYLHERAALLGYFRDANGKTAVKITETSGTLSYTLSNGTAGCTQLTASSSPPVLAAKIFTATPSFYFSSDADGKEEITKVKDAGGVETPLVCKVLKSASGNFTVTLSH